MLVVTPAPTLRDFQRIAAYNPCMHHATQSPLARLMVAGLDRLTLVANHVLAGEPQAVARLKPHSGRVVDAQGLMPALLPTGLAAMVGADVDAVHVRWRITPAGLLDRVAPATDSLAVQAADAVVSASTQSLTTVLRAMAAHDFSVVQVHGDAALAADIQWVIENVRWDYAGDLQRVLPSPVAVPVSRAAEMLMTGARRGVQALDSLWPRSASGPAGPAGPAAPAATNAAAPPPPTPSTPSTPST